MKKLAIASALLSALAITGTANAYQAEIGASAGLIDPDNGSSSGSFGVDGTYYFNPVQTRNAPLAEAAFLDRASNVNAKYQYDDYDSAERHRYGVGAEYFVPNSDFYLSGTVGRDDRKVDNSPNFDETVYSAEEKNPFCLDNWFEVNGVECYLNGVENDLYNDRADYSYDWGEIIISSATLPVKNNITIRPNLSGKERKIRIGLNCFKYDYRILDIIQLSNESNP